jgi:hypothetical protein
MSRSISETAAMIRLRNLRTSCGTGSKKTRALNTSPWRYVSELGGKLSSAWSGAAGMGEMCYRLGACRATTC